MPGDARRGRDKARRRVRHEASAKDGTSSTLSERNAVDSDLLICGSGLLGCQEVFFFRGKEVTRFRGRLVSFVVAENKKVPFSRLVEFLRRRYRAASIITDYPRWSDLSQ